MKRKLTFGLGISIYCLLLSPSTHAQNSNDDHQRRHHHRMGPFGPWSEPVNLGPIINTTFNEAHPSISPDGLSLFFNSNRPGSFGGVADIYVSQRASSDDPWGSPENLGPIVNAAGPLIFNGVPRLSPDAHWLFFCSNRPGGFGSDDIYVSFRKHIRDDFGWETPVNLGPGVNSPFDDCDPDPFVDPETGVVTLYFASFERPEGFGNWDLYTSTLGDDGAFGPASLVREIDTPFRETRSAIRRDGLELIFVSNRPGSLGPLDLWAATRESTDDPWSEPVNLGRPVNIPGFSTRAPSLSKDGTTLYLTSDLRPGGFGGPDLYVSTRTRLFDDDGGK
jgi:hypothetical protein